MKNTFKSTFLATAILATFALAFTSCLKDECSEIRTFVELTPVFMHGAQFRVDPVFEQSREFNNPGKIYYYGNHVFINEKFEGIHIIDNSNPEAPSNVGFIAIPGNLDIAIRNNILYADNYTDLITVDINEISQPQLICRTNEVFLNYWQDPQRGYLVRYDASERSTQLECSDPNFGDDFFERNGGIFLLDDLAVDGSFPTNENGNVDVNQSGTGGSLASFTIAHEHLYVINTNELTAFDLGGACPERLQTNYVAWNIETLFPYKQYLFIGASNGMYIYDASEPSAPAYVSEFSHANACDPVFVKDDIAYITLRNGTVCQNFINQLDVVDVSDIFNPTLISSYEMEHPHGLSVRDNILYLCEGDHGLKVFELDDMESISDNRIEHIKGINAIDAISLSSEHLMVIGDGGLYQYNSTKPSDLEELSYYSVQ